MILGKPFLLLFIIPLLASTSLHKYYISVTQINYIQEKRSVQITSRIFIDDFESILRAKYDNSITLAEKEEPKQVDAYTEQYLLQNIIIKINGKLVKLNFIGKEYDGDMMRCYLEVEGVSSIESFEVSNKVLFDIFEDQQNIIKTKINAQQKSAILSSNSDSLVLKFN